MIATPNTPYFAPGDPKADITNICDTINILHSISVASKLLFRLSYDSNMELIGYKKIQEEGTTLNDLLNVETDPELIENTEIDDLESDIEIKKKWAYLCMSARNLINCHPDYCTTTYEMATATFISNDYAKFVNHFKELMDLYNDMEKMILSDYNKNESFKYIIKSRNILLQCSNAVQISRRIIEHEFDKELELTKIFYTDYDHWFNDEYPNLLTSFYDTAEIATTKLEEMVLYLTKITTLISKLDQIGFDKMTGTGKLLHDSIAKCNNLIYDFYNGKVIKDVSNI